MNLQKPTSTGCAYSRRNAEQNGAAASLAATDYSYETLEHRQVQQRNEHLERLALLGQSLAFVSHESRNELHVLSAGLAVLSRLVETQQDAQRWTALLRTSVTRLHRLLEDVRNFASPVRLNCEMVSLEEIWQRAWVSLRSQWEKRQALFSVETNGPELWLFADAYRLEEVFRNLFDNALAACAGPVHIKIVCDQVERDGGNMAQIAVYDNGPGLTEEQKANLFVPFFTTKRDGTGLGLPIVKQILEAHGGYIRVEDTTSGTLFAIKLPCRQSE